MLSCIILEEKSCTDNRFCKSVCRQLGGRGTSWSEESGFPLYQYSSFMPACRTHWLSRVLNVLIPMSSHEHTFGAFLLQLQSVLPTTIKFLLPPCSSGIPYTQDATGFDIQAQWAFKSCTVSATPYRSLSQNCCIHPKGGLVWRYECFCRYKAKASVYILVNNKIPLVHTFYLYNKCRAIKFLDTVVVIWE